ncbi:MAG: DNA mismatch repair protein MutS, partial [Chloroflexia bacterium]|nr:DNA mismatch repair protein MutS [Chloroflexia bacterium]
GPWWLAPITVNVALFQLYGKRISGSVAEATPLHHAIAGYAEVFRLIGESESEAPMLTWIGGTLGEGANGATNRMRRFARICSFVIPRGSIIWSPMQMAFLWDVHVLHALERWRAATGPHTRAWFDSAGEWEALAALSVLAHDYPGWTFPDVDPAHPQVRGSHLAHPLIHVGEAVANDVTVGPRGTFLFVTGSNMSGKSTLLRAVGLNAVLAMAGAPVSASRLVLPEMEIWTCMRVEDSVTKGVSFFMAELQRLKAVVDAAGATGDRPVLYLLDEILQGTNTAERQIASRGVLAQLSRANAIGGVSSHDLSLVEGSDLESTAVSVHFAETFARGPAGPDMTFDYRLRPGLATSTNALALMELLGFDIRSMTPSE